MIEDQYVGSGASNIRKVFKKAKKNSPSIVFFDEFDSIAGKRNQVDGAQGNSLRKTINELLSEIDGFEQNSGVFVIASTNFPQSLDPAIIRPGRFDKILKIPLPSLKGRHKLLEFYLDKIKYDSRVDIDRIARETIGFNGADIKTVINLSILNAIKNKRKVAEREDFDFALDRVRVGILNKSHKTTKQEKYMTAIHEAGHTLAALLTPAAMPLNKVTILSKGQALG